MKAQMDKTDARASYAYPTDESATDVMERRLDSRKLEREAAMIRALTEFEWKRGLDYGCGTGRNIPVLIEDRANVEQLFAVDPHVDRLEGAKGGDSAESRVAFFKADEKSIRTHIAASSLDVVLICQVFPHMSLAAFETCLESMATLLKPGGYLIACFPFHALYENRDYFHVVDIEASLSDSRVSRRDITEAEFNRLAPKPDQNQLPVRAFGLPRTPSSATNDDLPITLSLPKVFEGRGFSDVSAFLYSIHESDNGKPLIGDMIVKLRRD